jgi:hypothetical protein
MSKKTLKPHLGQPQRTTDTGAPPGAYSAHAVKARRMRRNARKPSRANLDLHEVLTSLRLKDGDYAKLSIRWLGGKFTVIEGYGPFCRKPILWVELDDDE